MVIDEAHNFPDTLFGDSLKKILLASKNVRLLLLTATPVKNKPDDIIEMINYLKLARGENV